MDKQINIKIIITNPSKPGAQNICTGQHYKIVNGYLIIQNAIPIPIDKGDVLDITYEVV